MAYLGRQLLDRARVLACRVMLVGNIKAGKDDRGDQKSLHPKNLLDAVRHAAMDLHKFLSLKAAMICAIAVCPRPSRLTWLRSTPPVQSMGDENPDAKEHG